jgi:hypothetical protein
MDLQQAAEKVCKYLFATEDNILDEFANSNANSVSINSGTLRSIFIPGTRKDRALLVAHVDTVWHDTPNIKIIKQGNLLFSGNVVRGVSKKSGAPFIHGTGIGADDRAGVAALWELKNLGHSILLTNSEEIGCWGSQVLMAERKYADMIQDHSFAIQFDRRGQNDLVFYHVGTKKFKRYCEANTGFVTAEGSFSDIAVLCRDICGVNISIGYMNEHRPAEVLRLDWWIRTVETCGQWLSKDLPKFERLKRKA